MHDFSKWTLHRHADGTYHQRQLPFGGRIPILLRVAQGESMCDWSNGGYQFRWTQVCCSRLVQASLHASQGSGSGTGYQGAAVARLMLELHDDVAFKDVFTAVDYGLISS